MCVWWCVVWCRYIGVARGFWETAKRGRKSTFVVIRKPNRSFFFFGYIGVEEGPKIKLRSRLLVHFGSKVDQNGFRYIIVSRYIVVHLQSHFLARGCTL